MNHQPALFVDQSATALPVAQLQAASLSGGITDDNQDANLDKLILLDEITSYIILHDGPDSQGRGHPEKIYLYYEDLKEALERAQARGFAKDIKPFHFSCVKELYSDQENIDEVLRRKIQELLDNQFKGSLAALIAGVTARVLMVPLMDQVNGRTYRVATDGVAVGTFKGSPYKMLRRYLELSGNKKDLAVFKPHHLKNSGRGTASNQEVCEGLVKRKLDLLLKKRFKGDLVLMAGKLTFPEIKKPLRDRIAGGFVPVSMAMAVRHPVFGSSAENMIRWYATKIGREAEIADLETFHFANAKKGTYTDGSAGDALIVRKIDSLLPQYGNDLGALIASVNAPQLSDPIIEKVGGSETKISMGAALQPYKSSVFKIIMRYLELTGRSQEYAGLRPYHLAVASRGTYNDQKIVDELTLKVIGRILREECGSSHEKLISTLSGPQILKPLVEKINGHEFEVCTGQLFHKFDDSPYKMLVYYLKLKGMHKLAKALRPFHMATAAGMSKAMVDRLIRIKCDRLRAGKFKGNLLTFCRRASFKDLFRPMKLELESLRVRVRMNVVCERYDCSPYRIIKRYLQLTGELNAGRDFKHQHRHKKTNYFKRRTKDKEAIFNEQLAAVRLARYEGSLSRLISEVTVKDLYAPLAAVLDGQEIQISMFQLVGTSKDGIFSIMQRYLVSIGEAEAARQLKPYYVQRNISSKSPLIDQLIDSKITLLLRTKYGGDFGRFCAETSQREMLEAFTEDCGGISVRVNMSAVATACNSSPYLIVRRYLKYKKNKLLLEKLKPYHFGKSNDGTSSDIPLMRRLAVLQISNILQRYNDNFEEMLVNIRVDHIREPLVEQVGEVRLIASTAPLLICFKQSPYNIIAEYCAFTKRSFPYPRSCMTGSTANRRGRISGALSYKDLRKIRREDGTFETEKYGFTQFATADKQAARELLVEYAGNTLGDVAIQYLGLETEQFKSWRLIFERLNAKPSQAVVVESDERRYSAMLAVRSNPGRSHKPVMSGINIYCDKIENYLLTAEEKFNLVNLDYLGFVSPSKEQAIQSLFERGLLAERCVVCITLQNTTLAEARSRRLGYNKPQDLAVAEIFERCAGLKGYKINEMLSLNYAGGTKGEPTFPMFFMIFDLERVPQ